MEDIEVRIHEEINDYCERFKGLTIRQWICSVLMLVINVPLYFYSKPYLGDEIAQWLAILVAIPFGYIGFVRIQNLDAEKITPYIFRFYFSFAKPLPYKTEREIQAEKEAKEQAKQERLEKSKFYKLVIFTKKLKEKCVYGFRKRKTKHKQETKVD